MNQNHIFQKTFPRYEISEQLDALVDLMSNENDAIWMDSMEKLRGFGPLALPNLIVALNHQSEQTRFLAVNTLGHIGAVEAIPPLMKMLHDTDFEVCEAAREALRILVALVIRQ